MSRRFSSVRLRLLLATAAAAAVSLGLVAGPGHGATPKCAKKHEAKGCKLRKGTTYHFKNASDDSADLVQKKGSWTLSYNLTFDCKNSAWAGTPSGDNYPTNPRSGGGTGSLRVGKTYSFSGEEGGVNEDTGIDDRQSWTASVKINSAKKATLTFTQHRTQDGTVVCDGGGKVTLKRTK
jgi:hypothetical protein